MLCDRFGGKESNQSSNDRVPAQELHQICEKEEELKKLHPLYTQKWVSILIENSKATEFNIFESSAGHIQIHAFTDIFMLMLLYDNYPTMPIHDNYSQPNICTYNNFLNQQYADVIHDLEWLEGGKISVLVEDVRLRAQCSMKSFMPWVEYMSKAGLTETSMYVSIREISSQVMIKFILFSIHPWAQFNRHTKVIPLLVYTICNF